MTDVVLVEFPLTEGIGTIVYAHSPVYSDRMNKMIIEGLSINQFELKLSHVDDYGTNLEEIFDNFTDNQIDFLLTGFIPDEWEPIFNQIK